MHMRQDCRASGWECLQGRRGNLQGLIAAQSDVHSVQRCERKVCGVKLSPQAIRMCSGVRNGGLRGKASVHERRDRCCWLGDNTWPGLRITRSAAAMSATSACDEQQEEASAYLVDEVMMKERGDVAHHLVGLVVQTCACRTCR